MSLRCGWRATLGLALALLALPASAEGPAGGREEALAEAGWEPVDEAQGVRVWRKEVPGSPVVAFRGEATLDVPVARLIGVMMDASRGPRWVELLAESTWLREPSETEAIIYNRYDSPWPLQDRDYVLHRVLEIDRASRVVTSTYRSVEDPAMPEQACCIRGVSERTEWRFTHLGEERTRVEVEVLTDPRGSVPLALVELFQRSWPRNSILMLAAEARSEDVTPYPALTSW